MCANRISEKHQIPFRHLNDDISQIYLAYIREFPIGDAYYLCETKFRDYINSFQIFIDPSRDSDMCGYCKNYKQLQRSIASMNKSYERHSNVVRVDEEKVVLDETDSKDVEMVKEKDNSKDEELERIEQYPLTELKAFVNNHPRLSVGKKKKWIDIISDYEVLCHHRYKVKTVNKCYQNDIKNTPENTLILTIDFKQNIVIGNQQIEFGDTFRKKESRSILGIHLCSSETRYYVDYVSDCKTHSGLFVKQCLRHLFDQAFM